MLKKELKNCDEFTAGDNSLLRELLNPNKEELQVNYSLAVARVAPGSSTLAHKLKSAEVYYIIKGEGEVTIDDEKEKVEADQVVYIPPDAVQKIINTGSGELEFICIVDPAWKAEDEKILELPEEL